MIKRKYKCNECENIQEKNIWEYIDHIHIGKKLYLKCPICNKYKWHTKIKEV